MIDIKEIQNIRINKSEDICKLVEMLGYKQYPNQLQFNNKAFASSLLNFLDDNPIVMEIIRDWIIDNYQNFDHIEDEDEDEDEDECDNE